MNAKKPAVATPKRITLKPSQVVLDIEQLNKATEEHNHLLMRVKLAEEKLETFLRPGPIMAPPPPEKTLVSFNDGSYKTITHRRWRHSQWIHFTLPSGRQIHVNPKNVLYLEDQ